MRKQVETWQRSELTDVTAKVVIYEAFVRKHSGGGSRRPRWSLREYDPGWGVNPQFERESPRRQQEQIPQPMQMAGLNLEEATEVSRNSFPVGRDQAPLFRFSNGFRIPGDTMVTQVESGS